MDHPRLVRVIVVVLGILALGEEGIGQIPSTPPSRPRILFRAQDIPALQAKVTAAGTRSALAWNQMSTTTTWQCAGAGGACPGNNSESWRLDRSLRAMVENAARYAILGDLTAGALARTFLISGTYNAINSITPTGDNGYQTSSYPGVIAATYDLIRPLLTAAERTAVVAELEQWINTISSASSAIGPLSLYSGAADNYTFAWASGLLMSLLAIWGDSTRPNIPQDISMWMDFIRDGYLDAISPDGSIDESYGYANYGAMYSLHSMIAGMNCGFGDRIAGTNILKTSRWYAYSLVGDHFPWTGDCGPTHKGMRVDPILYYIIRRTQDSAGLWGIERAQTYAPLDQNLSTFAYSPFLSAAIHYPEGLISAPPTEKSAFFRDNRNLAPGGSTTWNKRNNNPEIGSGGLGYLHNGFGNESLFSIFYMIRDEWANHGHEDDGHLSLAALGRQQVIDRGYASPGGSYPGAQHIDHNIVTYVGGPAYSLSNYYNPPATEGRHQGTLRASLLSPGLDYLAGDHRTVWVMEKAERTVVLVRDPAFPYMLLADEVAVSSTTGQTYTYEQRWNAASAMSGAGTFQSPTSVSKSGVALRGVYLSPASLAVTAGAASTQSSSVVNYFPNKVASSGVGPREFVSVHFGVTPTSITPLVAPSVNARGGSIQSPAYLDRFLFSADALPTQDRDTWTDGQFAWIRRSPNASTILGYALAEGQQLRFQGLGLVASTERVALSVKDGIVTIRRAAALAGTTLPIITVLAPSNAPITQVTVDGVAAPFVIRGALVYIGSAGSIVNAGWTLPAPPISNDRFYSFTGGDFQDAEVPIGLSVGSAGTVSAVPGGSVFSPRSGLAWPNGPLYFVADVAPIGNPSTALATWRVGTQPGGTELGQLELLADPAGSRVRVVPPTGPVSTIVVPRLAGEVSQRVGFVYRPAQGAIEVIARSGAVAGTALIGSSLSSFHVRLWISGSANVDDIAFYDSAEDKMTPQGVVAWLAPNGHLGWPASAPLVLQGTTFRVYFAGVEIPAPFVSGWMSVNGFTETLYGDVLGAGIMPPSTLRETVVESAQPAVLPIPGISYTLTCTTPGGVILAGGAWIPPGP